MDQKITRSVAFLAATYALLLAVAPAAAKSVPNSGTATQIGINDTDDAQARAQSDDADKPLHFQFGILPHYLDNYYQTQEDFGGAVSASPRSATILTLSGEADYDLLSSGKSRLTAGAQVRHNIYTDIDHADSTDVDLSMTYSGSVSQLRVGYFGSRHQLVSDTPGNLVYGQTNGFNADFSYRLTPRLRARFAYRFSRKTYSTSNGRDLSEHGGKAELRYKVTSAFMPAIGFELTRGNTELNAFSYNGKAVYASVTSELGKRAYFNFRYRRSQRNYVTSVPTDAYFGRKDPRDDLSFYGTFQVGGGLSLYGFATHISNRSNQSSHKFKSNEVGLGLFYRF